jgi:nitroimidazol reductase NimA-like FMN-containing flavoprotein (pyridoxamine 5'-phosphate oxidase superfamily)
MRRKDKEFTDKAVIEDILNRAELVRIAMVDGQEPYVVTMNYAYKDNALFLHCALEGRKMDILKRNNRVAFTVDTDVSLRLDEKACDSTICYRSVFGTGYASLVEDPDQKARALDWIMDKHGGQGGYAYPAQVLARTAVLRIDIDYLSGKKSGY